MKSGNSKLVSSGGVILSTGLLMAALAVVWLVPRDAAKASAQQVDAGKTEVSTSHITVRGTGTLSAKPDTLIMNVGVTIQEGTIKEAQAKVSTVTNAMLGKLKAAGIDEKDYRTAQYDVAPVTDDTDQTNGGGTPKLTGFRITNILEVTFHDPMRAPDVLDALAKVGANTIYNTGYGFADLDSLSKQAYDKAVKDATDRAERLASLSNMKLGKIVSVSEAAANAPEAVYDRSAGMGAGGGVLAPGQQTVQVDVIVTYEATSSK